MALHESDSPSSGTSPKAGPAMPTQDVSTLADAEAKRIQQETYNRKYDAELNYYFTVNAEFENNWQKPMVSFLIDTARYVTGPERTTRLREQG